MDASILDLRYKMKNVLKALKRNERVRITHRGREQGVLIPSSSSHQGDIEDHPFFGMKAGHPSVKTTMDQLRGGRYRDL